MVAFSFRKALNTIEPAKGLLVSAYFSNTRLGSGAKPFLIIGVTGRYVTLLHIPTLTVCRIRAGQWASIPAQALAVDGIQLLEQLTMATSRHQIAGKRWQASVVSRAMAIIEEFLP